MPFIEHPLAVQLRRHTQRSFQNPRKRRPPRIINQVESTFARPFDKLVPVAGVLLSVEGKNVHEVGMILEERADLVGRGDEEFDLPGGALATAAGGPGGLGGEGLCQDGLQDGLEGS